MSLKEDLEPKRLGYYAIILLIAFVFAVQWGPGSKGCDAQQKAVDDSSAARVNGKEISLRDFHRQYTYSMRMFGGQIPESQARAMGFPMRVLDGMVDNELLAQEAARQGIFASDDEVLKVLQSNPEFHSEAGEFDVTRYKDALRNYYRKTPQEYELDIRRGLAISKMRQVIGEAAHVSDDEVKDQYFHEGNKAKLSYVRFTAPMFASKVPAPAAAEIAAYQKEHAKQIADDYQANAYVYQQPEKVHARHILVKVAMNAPQADKDAARAKIDALKKQLDGGKDFAELAKESSEDEGSKGLGGDLGLRARDAWVPEFAAAAFALKPGEVSAPVESPFGIHLIKVEEKKAAETKPLEAVSAEIATKLVTREKALVAAKVDAQKALAAAKGGKTLEDLFPAPKEKLQFESDTAPQAKTTEEFSVSADQVPGLPPIANLMTDVAAATGPVVLDTLYASGDGWLVAHVDSRTIPTEAGYTNDLAKLREDAIKAKQSHVQESYVKALRKSAAIKVNKEAVGGPDEPPGPSEGS